MCEGFLYEEKEIVGDRTKRRFSTDFYAYNIIEKYAMLLSDPLVSVRKNAVISVNEILRTNPFDADLDFNNLVLKYQEVVEERDKIEDIPDEDDEIVAKLSEKFGKFQNIVEEAVAEYFDIGNFPEIDEDPPIEDVQITHYIELAEKMENADDKKTIVFDAIEFCLKCGTFEADGIFAAEIVHYLLTKFHMRNLANMQLNNRAECIAEERRLRISRKQDELTRKEHDVLCAAQFALQMEECMKNASNALKHGQMAEISEIVKFLATCRHFKLRDSESAVMQICSLIYRNDPEIREFVVAAGKSIFFSCNSSESVSEKSTVQNLMQVMLPAKLEDRCVLSDTLVYIFESQPLKQGSLNFLWETAEKCKIFEHSIVAVQILQSYIKAIPSEGRKNFSRLHEMLLRRNDIFQIEVLQLAVCCGTVISTAKAKLNELVAPKFRIPSTDNFFQVAIKQLTDHLDLPKSHRFFHRAKLTFQAVYALCESPDELCNDVISSVLCHVKEVNYKFRTFRLLYKESIKTLQTLRKKLLEKKVEIIPCYSTVNDYELKFLSLDSEMNNLALMNATQDFVLDSAADLDSTVENNVLINIDPSRPSCYRGFRRFMNLKKRKAKHSTVSWKSKELQWLKKTEEENGDLIGHLKNLKECNVKHISKVYEQSNNLFILTRDLQHEWHILIKRLFFLTQQYIVRSIAFIHDTMTEGLEGLTTALTEIRKMPRGKITMMNLPEWIGEHLTQFERDNLTDLSIFKTNQGRIADATEQSVDGIISAQIESAIGYDWFRPGSILSRVYPFIMQTLRFRSRPLITNTLSDSAVYCLIKYMLASPNLCRRNISFVFHYLRTAKPDTRSNIVIMLADLAIRHPFSKQLRHYLLLIYDSNPNVRYTAILMIHYLYTVKAVQLPGQLRAHLAVLIVDPNSFISDMAKHFFYEVVTNHHIQISSIINDVIIRLYALKTKEFDFLPIVEFFFGFIDTVKESEHTMTILCKHLVTAAIYKEIEDEYDNIFANYLIICMKLIPKVSLNMVSTLHKSVDKFKPLLRRKPFKRLIMELAHIMHKKAHLKQEIKNEIDVLEKHVETVSRAAGLASRYDRTMIESRAETLEPNDTENTMDATTVEEMESEETVVVPTSNGDTTEEPMQID